MLIVLLLGLFSCKKEKEPVKDVFYEVSFNTASLPYDVTPPKKASVKAGETLVAPEVAHQPSGGYVVVWTKDLKEKTAYDFSSPVEESFTLYAVEVPRSYKVVYLLERGTNDKRNPTVFTWATETFSPYPPIMPFGYRFLKWTFFDDPDGQVDAIQKGTEGDVVLRAVTEAVEYTVVYLDPGDENPNPTTYLFGTELSLDPPLKEGYDFLGYTIADDKKKTAVTALTANFVYENRSTLFYRNGIDIYLKANWEKKQ